MEAGDSINKASGRLDIESSINQVRKVSSAERGKNILCCINAVGMFVPPLLGFPGKRKIESPMNGCPAGSTGAVNVCRSGYIDNKLFLKWMRLFVETVGDTKQTPHLLLLDSYESHKSLEVVVHATDNASRVLACVM